MGNVFKKTKTSKITMQDKAVLQLKQQRDKLRQYQKRIETNIERDRQVAKTLVAEGKTERALLLLRKKRYQETLLTNADKQLQNMEQLASDIEFAQVEAAVVDGLKMGSKALTAINATMDIDEIETLLEETQDAAQKQEEISALLSGMLSSADEDDMLADLDELMKQPSVEEAMATAAKDEDVALRLPDVPQARIKVRGPGERQLEAAAE